MQSRNNPLVALSLLVLAAGCASNRAPPAPEPVTTAETSLVGTVVGDDRSAMEAATDSGAARGSAAAPSGAGPAGGVALAPNAPESYVVKRGDTLWAIAKVFLRDPWYWPEIWQVNPQIQNPHLIYPGDTLRLVYIQGQPHIQLQRGSGALVEPRVRSQPLEAAVTTIPFDTVAAFMSRPFVLTSEQIAAAPYVVATRDNHVVMSEGNTLYARGFTQPADVGSRYNILRVGDELRDPDDNKLVGYNGIFAASGRVTRSGELATLLLTESKRETVAGDKLFPGTVEVPLDFSPSAPRTKVSGRIMAVNDGVTHDGVTDIGQYQVVVINRGARDGLAAGNVLAVYGRGEIVEDNARNGFVSGMSNYFYARKVRLPDERTGTFMVFKTFDRISYGLIMEAKDVIHVLDRVENP
jgi:hypothetical protein